MREVVKVLVHGDVPGVPHHLAVGQVRGQATGAQATAGCRGRQDDLARLRLQGEAELVVKAQLGVARRRGDERGDDLALQPGVLPEWGSVGLKCCASMCSTAPGVPPGGRSLRTIQFATERALIGMPIAARAAGEVASSRLPDACLNANPDRRAAWPGVDAEIAYHGRYSSSVTSTAAAAAPSSAATG